MKVLFSTLSVLFFGFFIGRARAQTSPPNGALSPRFLSADAVQNCSADAEAAAKAVADVEVRGAGGQSFHNESGAVYAGERHDELEKKNYAYYDVVVYADRAKIEHVLTNAYSVAIEVSEGTFNGAPSFSCRVRGVDLRSHRTKE